MAPTLTALGLMSRYENGVHEAPIAAARQLTKDSLKTSSYAAYQMRNRLAGQSFAGGSNYQLYAVCCVLTMRTSVPALQLLYRPSYRVSFLLTLTPALTVVSGITALAIWVQSWHPAR